MTDPTPAMVITTRPRASRRRRGLALVTLVLACLAILMSTIAVWTHQVVLKTDRFNALVVGVVDAPAIIAPISDRVSTQVVDALDIQGKVAAALPGPSAILAPAIANAVREAIDKRLRVVLADSRFQQVLLTTVSTTHEQLVRLVRDETSNLVVKDGYVYLTVFPIIGTALTELQSMGVIPAAVSLPDLSAPDAPDVLAGRLESALGISLPPTFGSIKVMPAERLLQARTVVRVFDIVVIVLLVLTVILVLLALWLASDRRQMVIALAIGTFISFILVRLVLRALLEVTFSDLRGLSVIILLATAILAVAALLIGRTREVVDTVSGATEPENRGQLTGIGLAIIGVVVLWIAVGPEVALLSLALLAGWWFVVGRIANDPA